jgi:hypothetical protein
MARLIVQDPTVLSGRWRLDGTTIAIAMLREDGNRQGRELTLQSYAFMDLTGEEYDAAMEFEFPELRKLVINPVRSIVLIECVCGEEKTASTEEAILEVPCICGRTWNIKLDPKLVGVPADEARSSI